jgi:hypothetical protein
MSTATDTNQPPNKRTRFSETNDETPSSSLLSNKVQPPKILAESFIRASIASLHPIIATDVEKLGKEHLLLLSKRLHLDKTTQRMVNDPDHIPTSARFKFELSCSDRVKETQEYKALSDTTIEIINQAQTDLRKIIIDASKLETAAITIDIQRHLAKAIRLITNAFLLSKNDKTPVDVMVYLVVKNHIDDISTHTPMSLDTFVKFYKDAHTIETFPPSRRSINNNTTTTSTDASVSRYFSSQQSQRSTTSSTSEQNDETPIVNPNINAIKNILENVFVSAWSRYLEQQTKNEISIELKKLSTTFFVTRSTSDATAVINAEPSADKKELKELIRLETVEKTKKLVKQLNDMQKELNLLKSSSKNSKQRGQGSASAKKIKPPSASTNKNSPHKKKQKSTKPSASSNQNKNNKRKAGVNNKENASGVKNSKRKNGNNKLSKNKSSSSNNKSSRSNKSSKK